MWNLALDGSGNPKLPGTNSCGGPGCRGIVTINSDGTYELNEECEFCIAPYLDDSESDDVWDVQTIVWRRRPGRSYLGILEVRLPLLPPDSRPQR